MQDIEGDPALAGTAGGQGSPSKADAAAASRPPLSAPLDDGERHHKWPDGGEYFGEWNHGLAHGRGIYVYPSGVA